MNIKIALVSATIVVMSTASAFATCAGKQHQEVMSCVEGTTFDPDSGTCVPVVNS